MGDLTQGSGAEGNAENPAQGPTPTYEQTLSVIERGFAKKANFVDLGSSGIGLNRLPHDELVRDQLVRQLEQAATSVAAKAADDERKMSAVDNVMGTL